jgi:hypothetical protein
MDLKFPSSLNLKPQCWTQAIKVFPNLNAHGLSEDALTMSVECATAPEFGPGHDLVLSDKTKLAGKRISISIIQGELPVDDQQRRKLEANSLGGLWYSDDDDWVMGWFYLKPKMYEALWDQVRIGNKNAVIRLEVSPVDEDNVWRSNPLSIMSVAIEFYHYPAREETAEKKSWFNRI